MKKTIVVGTFDSQIYEHLRLRLESSGFEVVLARRGVKILLEILDNEIDLLILDLDLAGVMGMDILPVIRRIRPRLPIILITEDVNAKIRKVAAELGVTYQAFKPMTNAETNAIAIASERLTSKPAFDFASA